MDDLLILFGGYYCTEDFQFEDHFNDLHSLDLSSMIWKKLNASGDIPSPRFGHTATKVGSAIYVFGGMS